MCLLVTDKPVRNYLLSLVLFSVEILNGSSPVHAQQIEVTGECDSGQEATIPKHGLRALDEIVTVNGARVQERREFEEEFGIRLATGESSD